MPLQSESSERKNFGRCSAFLAGVCFIFFPGDLQAQQVVSGVQSSGLRILPGHLPPATARLVPIGETPSSQHFDLAISLPVRDPERLDQLLGEIYDPASPKFHRYLTPEQFRDEFGALESDYDAVMAFARSNHFVITATHRNRLVLDVSATAAELKQAFHIGLRVYNHPTESRTFFAPDTEPTVDARLPILHVSGLDNYSLPHPNYKRRPIEQSVRPEPRSGSGPSGTYLGNDFRTAYMPGVSQTGTGQSVGLLEFDGYYPGDITAYESKIGLVGGPQLVTVAVDGGVSNPGQGNGEVALDIEMAISMAPGLAKVYVYEAPNPSPFVDLLSRMANDNLAHQLSCSWGGNAIPDPASEQIFKQMALQGQSFFNAAGDSDAFTGSIPFPCESPNITQVGGTTLTTGAGATYASETVWNWGRGTGSSGGVSTTFSIPSWQQGISMALNQGSTTMRNIPDVALLADNIYEISDNGIQSSIGGTSCAAPMWASVTALANQRAAAAGLAPVGFLNPALYAIGKGPNFAACFNDITTGDNTSRRSRTQFYAVAGYDLCTGWGTPRGLNLINALVPTGSSLPSITAQPRDQVLLTGSDASFEVEAAGSGTLTYQWRFNTKNISGATGSSYTRLNIQAQDSGLYDVIVGNAFGSITSSNARLSVVSHPLLTGPSWSSDGSFSFTLSGDSGFSYAIESTTNLSDWSVVATLPNPSGTVLFTSTNSRSILFQAFRARLVP